MKLRSYISSDQAELVDVWFEGWLSTGLSRPVVTKADLAARLPDDLRGRWTVTVAELDGRVVGFLAVVPDEKRLDQLFLRPDAQGCGLGAALYDVARTQLPDGFWLRTQAANGRARRFYEGSGCRSPGWRWPTGWSA